MTPHRHMLLELFIRKALLSLSKHQTSLEVLLHNTYFPQRCLLTYRLLLMEGADAHKHCSIYPLAMQTIATKVDTV